MPLHVFCVWVVYLPQDGRADAFGVPECFIAGKSFGTAAVSWPKVYKHCLVFFLIKVYKIWTISQTRRRHKLFIITPLICHSHFTPKVINGPRTFLPYFRNKQLLWVIRKNVSSHLELFSKEGVQFHTASWLSSHLPDLTGRRRGRWKIHSDLEECTLPHRRGDINPAYWLP